MSSIRGLNGGSALNNENGIVGRNMAAKSNTLGPNIAKSAFKDLTNSKKQNSGVPKSTPTVKGTRSFQIFSETPKSSIKPQSVTKKQQVSAKKKEVQDDDFELIQEYFTTLPPLKEQNLEYVWSKQNVIPDEIIEEVVPLRDTLGPDDWKKDEFILGTEEDFLSSLPPLPEFNFDGLNDDNCWDTDIPQLSLQPLYGESPVISLPTSKKPFYVPEEDDNDYMEEFNMSF